MQRLGALTSGTVESSSIPQSALCTHEFPATELALEQYGFELHRSVELWVD